MEVAKRGAKHWHDERLQWMCECCDHLSEGVRIIDVLPRLSAAETENAELKRGKAVAEKALELVASPLQNDLQYSTEAYRDGWSYFLDDYTGVAYALADAEHYPDECPTREECEEAQRQSEAEKAKEGGEVES
jgi:hypothetical protein